MQRLAERLIGMSGWRSALLVALVYAVFIAQVMAPQGAAMQALAGDWGAPDGHFFYTPTELYAELGNWPEAARDQYVQFRLGLDPLWALTYAAMLVVLSGIALPTLFPAGHSGRRLVLLPLLPMLLDIAENFLGIVIVSNLPGRLEMLAQFTAGVTAAKWLTLAAAHVVTVALLLAALMSKLRNSAAKSS